MTKRLTTEAQSSDIIESKAAVKCTVSIMITLTNISRENLFETTDKSREYRWPMNMLTVDGNVYICSFDE